MYITFANKQNYPFKNLINDIDYFINEVIEDLPDFLSVTLLFDHLINEEDFYTSKNTIFVNNDLDDLISSFNLEGATYQFITRIANSVTSYLKNNLSIEHHKEISNLKRYLLEPYFIKRQDKIIATDHLKILFMQDYLRSYSEREVKIIKVNTTFNSPIIKKLNISTIDEVPYIEFRFKKSPEPEIPSHDSLDAINYSLKHNTDSYIALSSIYNENKNDFAFNRDEFSFKKNDLDKSLEQTVAVAKTMGIDISYADNKVSSFLNHLHKDPQCKALYSLDEAVIILSRIIFDDIISDNIFYSSTIGKIKMYEGISVSKQFNIKHEKNHIFHTDFFDFYNELIRFSNDLLVIVKVSKFKNENGEYDQEIQNIYEASKKGEHYSLIRFHITYTLFSFYNITGYLEFDNFQSVLEDINDYLVKHCYKAIYKNQLIDLSHFNKSLAKWFTEYDFKKYPITTEGYKLQGVTSNGKIDINQLFDLYQLKNINKNESFRLSNTFSSLNYYHLLLNGKYQYPIDRRKK